MKYKLTINLGELDCGRGETQNPDLCSVQRVSFLSCLHLILVGMVHLLFLLECAFNSNLGNSLSNVFIVSHVCAVK
jgi:hypothetical protein